MAFASASPSPFGGAGGGVQSQVGPDLPEVSTEAFGFQTIAGQTKLRLLPSPWPADGLPPPTASLLSIASRKGLLAAVGPQEVYIASTDMVRRAYNEPSGDGDVKPFTPQLSLNLGLQVSQVTFSADEDFLVLSAQNGGGLAVYEVANIMNGATQSSFELSTNGMTLRHMIPNPTTEKAELFALVTDRGQLLMANLKTRELLSRGQGPVMKEAVSCVSWSNRGKQLVAGLGDGTCFQMTPEGEEKGILPRPPYLEGDQHVSSISWLENDIFLVAHTPTFHESGMPPMTQYTLITRAKAPQKEVMFQKLPEPCFPSGLDRATPYQFIQRLRDFPPNLTDAIIVASTGSEDIGLVTRSKIPLSGEQPADQVNTFTTTSLADDSRRAQMPMNEELQTTSPIGVALDLSSKDKVPRPLPKEEFDDSPGPLPALMILNNEGILMTWWFVYADSIRQSSSFPGLAALSGIQAKPPQETQRQASPFATAGQQPAPLRPSSFGQSSTSLFGSTATASAFGAPSNLSAASKSPWTNTASAAPTTSAFGKPAFGSPTPAGAATPGPAFGQSGGLGRASPWGTPQTGSAPASGSAFGQTGSLGTRPSVFGGNQPAAPFGSTATTATPSASGGFASFAAKTSPFMATGTAPPAQNVFGQPSSGTAANSFGGGGSIFGQSSIQKDAPKPAFGGSSGFTLGSTFKTDGTAANDAPKPPTTAGNSMFGSHFGETLGKAGAEEIQTKDADMEDDTVVSEGKSKENGDVTATSETVKATESSKPGPQLLSTAPPNPSGLFGTQSQSSVTPADVGTSQPAATWSFGKVNSDNIAPREIHVKGNDFVAPPTSPKIKIEPKDTEENNLRALSEAPLPPESTSKASFAPGDSSNSSKSSNEEPTEPPLPPDPFPTKSKLNNVENSSTEPPLPPDPLSRKNQSSNAGSESNDHPLPPDPFPSKKKESKPEPVPVEHPELPDEDEDEDEGADDESSGVDVAQELESPSDHTQSPKVSAENSFSSNKSSTGGLFSMVPNQKSANTRPSLFGEVNETSGVFGKPSVPFLPPPNKSQESPRSPSPVRQSRLSAESLRPDNSRSISAPGLFNPGRGAKPAPTQVAVPAKQTQLSIVELRKRKEQEVAAEQAKRAAEEEQSLSDEEDELVRRELETPVAGSRSLDPFLAHQDYVGRIDKRGIPGQIEKVYRDINSMIDTLGLNARSLTAFVKGHSEQIDEGEISAEDLEHEDDFALDEITKLIALESQLANELDSHRLHNVHSDLSICRDIRKEMQSLHHKRNDMTKAIEFNSNPELIESLNSAPLSLDQASQQHELRKRFAHFQKLLAQAEGDLTMLRAKLATTDRMSNSRPSSSAGGPPLQKKPTVEAVTKTILKMTNMIEKKSGDIDALETQMRSLRLPSVEAGPIGSREGSPFSSSKGTGIRGNGVRKGFPNGTAASSLSGSPLRRSLNGAASSSKTGPSDPANDDETQYYRLKAQRRRQVNELVKHVFEKSGPMIRTLD